MDETRRPGSERPAGGLSTPWDTTSERMADPLRDHGRRTPDKVREPCHAVPHDKPGLPGWRTLGAAADPEEVMAMESAKTSNGRLSVLCGCMFAGKTTELIRRASRLDPGKVAIFKHAIDDRYAPDAVVSHAGKALRAVPVQNGAELVTVAARTEARLAAIDEGHFFDATVIMAVDALRSRGVDVLLATLDRDSWGRPFPVVDRLRAVADEVIVLYATCARCGGQADRTQRLTPIQGECLVGGPESYEPRCARCWHAPRESPPGEPAAPTASVGHTR